MGAPASTTFEALTKTGPRAKVRVPIIIKVGDIAAQERDKVEEVQYCLVWFKKIEEEVKKLLHTLEVLQCSAVVQLNGYWLLCPPAGCRVCDTEKPDFVEHSVRGGGGEASRGKLNNQINQ